MADYMLEHLVQIVGKKITGVVVDKESAEEFGEPLYGLKLTGGCTVWVLCDPEGNGPGFLDIVGGKGK